jgi:heterodisulfide reductase subunit A-like polyferredoxin
VGQQQRGTGRWYAHVQVPLSDADAAALEAANVAGQRSRLRVERSTKVRVDDVLCAHCRRGVGRCTGGDPDAPCSGQRRSA